ncbi:hypothetical protein [Orientia tsutsugamushi]|uniref:Uncharacterized protein n=1 Tax=Orientia tsutsugamushi TaxID=784 RepID=A0A2U3RSQ9_ORITS|nr:hypothetical protein [Orientia tsutsugamushi]KJV57129.1 hypothetical protein OTSKARP_0330 [Orientia tsutsugamushi str. Karp]SPR16253.1 Uncharacterised protein [Orientia tsutsugamushi]
MKLSGKRNTGNPYVTFDLECDGNMNNKTTAPSPSTLPSCGNCFRTYLSATSIIIAN